MTESREGLTVLLADIDGTLLDTRRFVVDSFVHSIQEVCDYDVEVESADALFGLFVSRETFRLLAPANADLDTLCRVQTSFQAANLHLVTPFPGVIDTLSELRDRDIKIAAVTGRTANTHAVLEIGGILPYFNTIVCGDDVEKHKPHPQGIRMALDHLNAASSRSIMLGDQTVDIQAGKRAGTQTAAVTWGILGKRIGRSRPDHRIERIEEVLSLF